MTDYSQTHYTKTAITLHWVIAVCIILQLATGLLMSEEDLLDKALKFEMYQFHKSLGLTVIILTLARIVWRLTHKTPPLPVGMKKYEIFLAQFTHVVFYGLMLALPLTGWAIVSTSSWGLPTLWFGVFEWPHIPFLSDLNSKAELNEGLSEAHEILGTITMALIALHIGAALKHHFILKDNVLTRMLPFLKVIK